MFLVFAGSAHAGCGQGRPTACGLQIFQGGIVGHISWVPNPVPLPTAESESNCYSAAISRMRFPLKAIMNILYGDPDFQYTVPVFVDSTAAISMNASDRPAKRTRHIETRYWYGRCAISKGHAKLCKVKGDTQQPADVETHDQASPSFQHQQVDDHLL